MIAGAYTPFTVIGLGGPLGHGLLVLVWLIAALGMPIKLLWPRRFERTCLVLYLALGWIILPVIGPVVDARPLTTFMLLVGGGILYTAGVIFHLWETLAYHNAIWHAFILAAAGAHYVAVLQVVAG